MTVLHACMCTFLWHRDVRYSTAKNNLLYNVLLFFRAAARIMEEHKRNMENMSNQLSISKLRQEKQ